MRRIHRGVRWIYRNEPKCGAGATYPATPTRVSREATSDRRAAA
jgi:hypothetical protein